MDPAEKPVLTMTRRVLILGAGVTGLAAADRLLELGGCDVTVVEAEPTVGGLAATVVRDGIATDLGPHRLHSEIAEVQTLLPQLLGDRLLRVRRSSRIYLDGKWLTYPLRAGEVLRVLGVGTVARLAAAMVGAKAGRALGKMGVQPASFADAMRAAFGGAAYRKVIEPYARKVWRAEPASLSAEIARVRLPDQSLGAAFGRALRLGRRRTAGPVREFGYVRGGIGQLGEILADRIRSRGGKILLNSRATALRAANAQPAATHPPPLQVVVQQGTGQTVLDADTVISTIPLPQLGAMLPGGDEHVRSAFAKLEYLSIILVVLVAAKERLGPDHWLYFPQTPPLATRACEPKNFDASLAPAGRTALCCEITARCDEPLWAMDDGQIAAQIERELAATGLFEPRDIVSRFVLRRNWAYPIYTLGYEKSLAAVWPFLSTFPNLVTTGRQGLFNHNNIDHALVMGRCAAEAVAASTAPARQWYASLDRFSTFRIWD
ncbi:MAG: FAD-dependent oxidoreductase [Candidatus Sumerlaeia bacterium]|nr:FAD-dependent oxidoreductase [Candidatus Sumerlaeia bacterium]